MNEYGKIPQTNKFCLFGEMMEINTIKNIMLELMINIYRLYERNT